MEVLQGVPEWVEYLYVDSLSEIYDLLKRELKSKFKPAQNFQKFEEMQSMLFHAIRVARQLPISVFFVCHTKKDKNGLTLEENLAFDGKTPEDLKKQFDLIVHMDDVEMDGYDKPVKALVTNPSVSTVAKRRVSPWLNIEVNDYEEPNLYKLTQKLLGKGA